MPEYQIFGGSSRGRCGPGRCCAGASGRGGGVMGIWPCGGVMATSADRICLRQKCGWFFPYQTGSLQNWPCRGVLRIFDEANVGGFKLVGGLKNGF